MNIVFWFIFSKLVKLWAVKWLIFIKRLLDFKNYLDTLDMLGRRGGTDAFIESMVQGFLIDKITDCITQKNGNSSSKESLTFFQEFKDRILNYLNPISQFESVISKFKSKQPESETPESKELESQIKKNLEQMERGTKISNGKEPTNNNSKAGDPILISTGEFEREVQDLFIKGAGMDFEFKRVYRSGVRYFGPLSFNWDHSYNLRLRKENDFILVFLNGNLSEQRFVRHPRYGEIKYNYFTPPNGTHDVIISEGGGSFKLLKPRGTIYLFENTKFPDEHRIKKIEDRFGNYLEFKYDPNHDNRLQEVFVNSTSRNVKFYYDNIGRIERIEDHAKRVVIYRYDEWGYLQHVIGPAFRSETPTKFESYEYDIVGSARNLKRVYDWKGRIIIENDYEINILSEHFGKIVRQQVGRGESYFTYQNIQSEVDPNIDLRKRPATRVFETMRNGHNVEHILNFYGNELERREILVEKGRIRQVVTKTYYNADGNIIAILNPHGILTQYLYERDNLNDFTNWPDIDHVITDVTLKQRMNFGNLLAKVIRGKRVTSNVIANNPNFWDNNLIHVKQIGEKGKWNEDVVIKYRYDQESQLLISESDPRYTKSADPLHVESAPPGTPYYNLTDPLYIKYTSNLIHYDYSPFPNYELRKITFPDRTYPSIFNGLSKITGISEETLKYDLKGRPEEKMDSLGYKYYYEYYPKNTLNPIEGAKEGFLKRHLIPHQDLIFNNLLPKTLEIAWNGVWTANINYYSSSGTINDSVKIKFEGVRCILYQSKELNRIVSSNSNVKITIDGTPRGSWDQSINNFHLIDGLHSGIHEIELHDVTGDIITIGRLLTHVAIEYYDLDLVGNVLNERDARGNITTRHYDVFGNVTQKIKGPSQVYYDYEPSGYLERERFKWNDENGHQYPEEEVYTHYERDPYGLIIRETKGSKKGRNRRIIENRYDPEDNLRISINPRGVYSYYDFDQLGRQTSITQAACSKSAATTRFEYDLGDRILSKRNPRCALHYYGYKDNKGLLLSGIDNLGNKRIQTDALGHLNVNDYDNLGNVAIERKFQLRNDKRYELISHKAMKYDEHGDLISSTIAIFETPIITTNPIFTLDAELKALPPSSVRYSTIEYYLDEHGTRISIKMPDGGIIQQKFDGQRRLYDKIDQDGTHTYNLFDGSGNIIQNYIYDSIKDSTGSIINYESFINIYTYDELNRRKQRINPYGNKWEHFYDSLNNEVCIIDPLGNVVRSKYDAYGKKRLTEQELTDTGLGTSRGGTKIETYLTERYYDDNGNLLRIKDPANRISRFKYDPLDREIETWFDVSLTEPREISKYDKAGNLISITMRNGLIRTSTFNALNQIVLSNIDASAVLPRFNLAPSSMKYLKFDYDANGNIILHENDYCSVRIDRDSRGLPLSETIAIRNIPKAPPPKIIQRTFDLCDRKETFTYPSGRIVRHSYNIGGNLESIQNLDSLAPYPGDISVAHNYKLANFVYRGQRLSNVGLGNGFLIEINYDGRGFIFEKTIKRSNGNELWYLQQLKDEGGHTRIESFKTRAGEETQKYSLDSIYRLTHYKDVPHIRINPTDVKPPSSPEDPNLITKQTLINNNIGPFHNPSLPNFEYEKLGNRRISREDGVIVNYTLNDLNQYNKVGVNDFSYDLNGNLLDDAQYLLKYDYDNFLLKATSKLGPEYVNYYRDALGRVIAEKSHNNDLFRIYDNFSPILDLSCITGGYISKEFTIGSKAEIIHCAFNNNDYWFAYDYRRSLRFISDLAGSVISLPCYHPYGFPLDTELTLSPISYSFGGMWFTPKFPFNHTKVRTYKPDIGRFIQRDPVGLLDDLNPYNYCSCNPVDFLDPIGLGAEKSAPVPEDPDVSKLPPYSDREYWESITFLNDIYYTPVYETWLQYHLYPRQPGHARSAYKDQLTKDALVSYYGMKTAVGPVTNLISTIIQGIISSATGGASNAIKARAFFTSKAGERALDIGIQIAVTVPATLTADVVKSKVYGKEMTLSDIFTSVTGIPTNREALYGAIMTALIAKILGGGQGRTVSLSGKPTTQRYQKKNPY